MATNNKDFVVKNGLQVGDNASITGALTAAGLQYPVSDGTIRQAMVTDGFGVLSFENLDDVRSEVTNQSGALIPKGTPVYQTGAAGQTLTIGIADASNVATMPAIGVAASDIADGDTGYVIHFGRIQGVNTSAFSEGDKVYVAIGGGYTNVQPAGESSHVQFLGVVTKVHATNGSGVMFGAGSELEVPNLDDGKIFIGNAFGYSETATLDTDLVPEGTNLYHTAARAQSAIESAQHLTIDGGTLYIDTDTNRIGINDTSPQQALDVTGAIAISGTTVIDSGGEVVTAQLKNSGVTAGSYGSASQVPVITVDSKGRITSASTTAVAGVSSFLYDSLNQRLIIGTADGQSFNASIALGGSLNGPLDAITVKYQPSAPTSPIQGQFYFDSLNQKLMIYTGASWVDAVPPGTGTGGGDLTDAVATFEKYQYITASTTNAISGIDANGNTLSYVVDGSQNIEVYVNGIKQFEGASNDYVATTGTSVTFTYNLPAGSVVDVQVYELLTQDAFYLKSETYTKTETNSQISTALTSYTATGADTNYVNVAGDSMSGALSIGISNGEALTLNNTDSSIGGGESLTFSLEYPNAAGSSTGWRHISRYAGGAYQIARNIDNVGYTAALTILENGKIGIGVENPTRELHIQGGAGDTGIRISSENNVADWFVYSRHAGASAGTATFCIYDQNAGNDRLSINALGKVGIGTLTPAARLDVNDLGSANGSSSRTAQFANLTVGATSSYLYIGAYTGTDWKIGKNVLGTADRLNFDITDSNDNLRMSITTSGELLIGTTSAQRTAPGIAIGKSADNDNTDYGITIARHGTGSVPGSFEFTHPAIRVIDTSGQGPASYIQAGALLNGDYGRLVTTDTNTHLGALIDISYDSGLSPLRMDLKGNMWLGHNRSTQETSSGTTHGLFVAGPIWPKQGIRNVNYGNIDGADSCLPPNGYSFGTYLTTGASAQTGNTTPGADGHIWSSTWTNGTQYGAQLYIDTDPTNAIGVRTRSSTGNWQSWKVW